MSGKTDTKQNFSDMDILKTERDMVQENPMRLVEFKFLTIKTKTEQMVYLTLNSVQKIIVAIIAKLIREQAPIRILILKARQMGVSTLIEGIIYAFTSQREGINSLVVADDIKGSNYIFEMQKLFHEKLYKHVKPKVRHSNEKKLEFDGIHSQVLIDTAENPNVGRKFTLQYAHLSEGAFFKDLNGIMLGLSQSVPNAPNTMIAIESTANGVGNDFYTRWCDAIAGKSDWKAIFIPWFELPEYSLHYEKDMYPIEGIKGDRGKFLNEERKLKQRFNLTEYQLNWRRWCIVNNCNGDVNLFMQEYPATWQEAFIMSGSLFFDRDALLEQEARSEELIKKRQFPKVGDIVMLDSKYVFREYPGGRFRVYEFPDKRDAYCIGADASEGLVHGDDSAMVVLNKRTNRTACAYNCQVDTDEFALDLIKAGHFFNMAMIAPENKGYGTAVCKKVYQHYGNIFRKIRDKSGKLDVTDELGWNTNVSTRPQMLMQLKEEVRENATDILDSETLGQMRTFINHPKKKRPEAEEGKKDDLVFARSIAGMVRVYYPSSSRSSGIHRGIAHSQRMPLQQNQGYGFSSE